MMMPRSLRTMNQSASVMTATGRGLLPALLLDHAEEVGLEGGVVHLGLGHLRRRRSRRLEPGLGGVGIGAQALQPDGGVEGEVAKATLSPRMRMVIRCMAGVRSLTAHCIGPGDQRYIGAAGSGIESKAKDFVVGSALPGSAISRVVFSTPSTRIRNLAVRPSRKRPTSSRK